MKYFCLYGNQIDFNQIYVSRVNREDYVMVNTWIDFDREVNPVSASTSERTNFLPWDIAIRNIGYYNADLYKFTSRINGIERLEALLHVELNKDNEVRIEALEAAPWNRELYLGEQREFRKIGLLLLAKSIIYGLERRFCGTIRLESLEVREDYYRNGLSMIEEDNGVFIYTTEQCAQFLSIMRKKGFLRF